MRKTSIQKRGLSKAEVLTRQQKGFVNKSPSKKTKSVGEIVRNNTFTLFNLINLIIAICLIAVKAYANITFILVVMLNVVIGIIQELNAKRLVQKLSLLAVSKVTVYRDNSPTVIPVEGVVTDDLLLLKTGEQICADSVITEGQIEVNESLLTGEADPIIKVPGDNILSGSFIVSGQCFAKVENVGKDNYVHKLASEASKQRKVKSELIRAMGKVTKLTAFFILPVGIILFIEAFFLRHSSLYNSVTTSAAAILGMLPKGLVLLISISLVGGIIKLSRKKVLVQELHCLETLAHVDVLCLDKTGTITEGKMQVSDIEYFENSALPFSPEEALRIYVNTSQDNNATMLALEAAFPDAMQPVPTPFITKVPFSSGRKWGGITFESWGTFILGGADILCRDDTLKNKILACQTEGNRVLLLGYSPLPIIDHQPPVVTPVALISLTDPVRTDAKATFRYFEKEGIQLKIISGDSPATVAAVAKEAGFEKSDFCVDCSAMTSEEELHKAAEKFDVFGRVSPSQKCELIKALQAGKHTVAMTGDGVNDVLALRQADCSIAIGEGSDAARQISQLVLLDSSFSSLPEILGEGRRVVNNITRVASLFFIKTLYSAVLSIFCILTATEFPFIPIQITLMDGVLEGFPSFFLSFEPNRKRASGSFLTTVFKNSVPFALMVFLNHLFLIYGGAIFGYSGYGENTVLYLVTGFIYLFALFMSCRPLNPFRIALGVSASAAFYALAWVFSDFIQLDRISYKAVILFICLSLLCIPLYQLFKFLIEKTTDLYHTRNIVNNNQ